MCMPVPQKKYWPVVLASTAVEQVKQRIWQGDAGQDKFVAKARVYIAMVDNPGTLPDPAPQLPDPNDLDNPTNRPGRFALPGNCMHGGNHRNVIICFVGFFSESW